MLCEKCKKKKASLYYNENIGGKHRSFHLCADCASIMEASGELEDLSTSFPSFDSPFSLWETIFPNMATAIPSPASQDDTPDRACPSCGTEFKEITSSGRVGCPRCYEIFSTSFTPLIYALHGNHSHTGALPRIHRQRAQKQARIGKLRDQLKEAIATEAYEQAAVLRDEIHRLEDENKSQA